MTRRDIRAAIPAISTTQTNRASPVPTALLLIGHGSARHPDAADGLIAHADALRLVGQVDQVAVGLLNGTPSVEAALTTLTAERVHVVPFFMEDGCFSRIAVPRAVNAVAAGRRLQFGPPVGVHAGLGPLIERRVLAWCQTACLPPASLSVVLVGHGSARAPGRLTATHTHARWLTERGCFAAVHVAFLEEAPFAPDVLAGAREHPVAVVGLFAHFGRHARNDMADIIGAENALRVAGIADLGFVGDDPGMRSIILDQAGLSRAEDGCGGRI